MKHHDSPIDRPVFVIGTGRCGLTPLMDLVAYHRDFAWPSQYNVRYPNRYWVSKLSRITDWSILNNGWKYKRRVPRHDEAFGLWNRLFHGFRRPFRDLTAGDVTPHVKQQFQQAVAEIMRHQGKQRFIAEYSGWSRIGFMREIFPTARFIHIVRDGRAVAHSLIHVEWWLGWEGVYKWRWGVPEPAIRDEIERYDGSFVALAAAHWKMLMHNLVAETERLDAESRLVVRYEDLVKNPLETARECCAFAGVDFDTAHFQRHLRTVHIYDANNRRGRIPSWKNNLRPDQVEILNTMLHDELAAFGYLDEASEPKETAASEAGASTP